ncbi:MAG TPA: choice-of-anchor D domain-containing protein [Terriglobales bacterium]
MRSLPLVAGLLFCLALPQIWAQELHCKPCWHDFDKVQIGRSSSFSIELLNTGREALRITSKSKRGREFSFGRFPLPVKVQPGASVELIVIFTPTAKGYSSGVVRLVSTAKDSLLAMHFTGIGEVTAADPQLSVSPATLNFGNVTVGSSTKLQAKLTASNAAVTVSSDRSNSSEFTLLGLKLPATIPAGQSVPVTIQFTPNASGTATGKAGFISDAANSPAVEQLTGTGVAQSSHSVDLSWDAGADNIVGYNLYRGTAQGGPYEQINTALDSSTSYTDATVVSGTTYYYVTTEVNAQGQESGYSNVAKAVIPSS